MAGYVGVVPVPQATQHRERITATAGQTSFATAGYTVGFIDVYVNGVRLVDTEDYTATNGSDIVLVQAAAAGDVLEYLAFIPFNVNGQRFTGTTTIDDLDATILRTTDASLDKGILTSIDAIKNDTAVDVFVYDTSRDSDGGAWRHRCQHTSWYNEPLNTTVRGSRKEFPSIAVIVAEASKITIYDGDDATLPMWMVINAAVAWNYMIGFGNDGKITGFAFKNGILGVAVKSGTTNSSVNGVFVVSFAKDAAKKYTTSGFTPWPGNIADRNGGASYLNSTLDQTNAGVISTFGNDIAIAILPDAPIDSESGLQIPTIAVATEGGVSVIKDDKVVVSKSYYSDICTNVILDGASAYINGVGPDSFNAVWRWDYLSGTVQNYGGNEGTTKVEESFFENGDKWLLTKEKDTLIAGYNAEIGRGIRFFVENKDKPLTSMIAYATHDFATGFMPGDIRGAWLAETDVTNLGEAVTEHVTNGGFSDGTLNGFTYTEGKVTVNASNQAVLTTTDSVDALLEPNITLVAGVSYRFAFELVSQTANTLVRIYNPTDGYFVNQSLTAAGIYEWFFTPTVDGTRFYVMQTSDAGAESVVDNFTVKNTNEIIENGTFDTNIIGWTNYDATRGDLSWISSGQIRCNNSGTGNTTAIQTIPVVVGQSYTASVDVHACVTATPRFAIGSTYGSEQYGFETLSAGTTGKMEISFIATSTDAHLYVMASGTSGSTDFDNITVRPAVDDRSVKNKGLQAYGLITREPVATGADLVAYSTFSASNYLEQPYNADLDFGTGDFSIMGWVNSDTANGSEVFLSKDEDVNTHRWAVYFAGSEKGIRFWAGQASVGVRLTGTKPARDGNWHFFVLTRVSGVLHLYIDGQFDTSASYAESLTYSTNSRLRIGTDYDGTSPMDGSISFIRISATAPSAEQIKRIYDDERHLFEENAACTIYGTSDAVPAISYDHVTNLLYVGTSSGRSTFQGLRRINNTTDAVTTAISAHNNMVVEQ